MAGVSPISSKYCSRRKKAQNRIRAGGFFPSEERGFKDMPKVESTLTRYYLDVRRIKTQNGQTYLESRDGDLVSHEGWTELTAKFSALQTADDVDLIDEEEIQGFGENTEADLALILNEDAKMDQTSESAVWKAKFPKSNKTQQELDKIVEEIRLKTQIVYDGVKTLSFPIQYETLSKSEKGWLKRGLFNSDIPPGHIKTIAGQFPPPDFQVDDVPTPHDKRANPSNLSANDFIYIRKRRAYWITKRTGDGGSIDGFTIPEIPHYAISLEFREGYRLHLEHERLPDEVARDKANPEAHSRAIVSLNNVTSWIDQDQNGIQPNLQAFIANRQMKNEMNTLSTAQDAEDVNKTLSAESMESESDRIQSPTAPRTNTVNTTGSSQANLSVLDEEKLRELVVRPNKDYNYLQEARDWDSELLKIHPDLKSCKKCGSRNHKTGDCTRSQDNIEGSHSEDNYYTPAATSLAAQNNQGFVCVYPYCRDRSFHVLTTCDALHQRCSTCKCRGHDNKVHVSSEGIAQTQCPEVTRSLNDKVPNSANGPSYHELLLVFEKHARDGAFTKHRFNNAGCGFYPARGEGDTAIIAAIGYKWLTRLDTGQAINFINRIHNLCTSTFGEKALQFAELPDNDWTTVFKKRAELSRRDSRTRSDGTKPAKVARMDSPSPKRTSSPRPGYAGPSTSSRSGSPSFSNHSSYSGQSSRSSYGFIRNRSPHGPQPNRPPFSPGTEENLSRNRSPHGQVPTRRPFPPATDHHQRNRSPIRVQPNRPPFPRSAERDRPISPPTMEAQRGYASRPHNWGHYTIPRH